MAEIKYTPGEATAEAPAYLLSRMQDIQNAICREEKKVDTIMKVLDSNLTLHLKYKTPQLKYEFLDGNNIINVDISYVDNQEFAKHMLLQEVNLTRGKVHRLSVELKECREKLIIKLNEASNV